jgi:hypothetical protein
MSSDQELHREALDLELDGRATRADFYWHQAHLQLHRSQPEEATRLLASDLFIKNHRALVAGYLVRAKSADIDRGFVHTDYAWSLAPVAGWTDSQIMANLGALGVRQIRAALRAGSRQKAQDLASRLLVRDPEKTLLQNVLAETYIAEAQTRLAKGQRDSDRLTNATLLANALYRIKKLRLDYPHNLFLFQSAAQLHLLRARELARCRHLSEALVDLQAASVHQPELAGVEELRANIEAEIQKSRIIMAAPEEERPKMKKHEVRAIAELAASGFRLADDYRRSDEARSVAEDLPVALGRKVWEDICLPPIERVDLRPLALKDAIDTIANHPPRSREDIPAAWDWVARDNPHLASLERDAVHGYLAHILFGDPVRVTDSAPNAQSDPAPITPAAPRRSSEPFVPWLLSSEGGWLKALCLLAIIVSGTAITLCMREYSHRQIRASAYQELRDAYGRSDYDKVIEQAEVFLSNPITGRDTRTAEVQGIYSEALVRWFTLQQPSTAQTSARMSRFRQLTQEQP